MSVTVKIRYRYCVAELSAKRTLSGSVAAPGVRPPVSTTLTSGFGSRSTLRSSTVDHSDGGYIAATAEAVARGP